MVTWSPATRLLYVAHNRPLETVNGAWTYEAQVLVRGYASAEDPEIVFRSRDIGKVTRIMQHGDRLYVRSLMQTPDEYYAGKMPAKPVFSLDLQCANLRKEAAMPSEHKSDLKEKEITHLARLLARARGQDGR